MKKVRVATNILVLLLVLVVPGFLYYLLVTLGKNRYHRLPIFGPKQLAKTTHKVGRRSVPDTIYHILPDFKLTDQDGGQVTAKTFDKRIFVAGFFYTHCPGVCAEMNNNLSQLAAIYAKNKMVYFASITVDPARDSVKALKKYAAAFKPATPKWLFLTGDTSTIYKLARKGFLVNALQTGKNDFIYSDQLILVDSHKRIRGYYTGAKTDDVSRLNDEIRVLIQEELLTKEEPLY
jgi:protein SCO1